MIEDLKADSERWDTERRKGGARSSAGGQSTTGANCVKVAADTT